jgi:hypothetical protein
MRAGAWNPPGTSALSGAIAQQPAAAEPMRVPLMPGSQLTLARRLG